MEPKLFVIGTILLTIVILFTMVYTQRREGFESLEDKIQDRGNPLAATQNPLKNPAAPIGISEAQANSLREVSAYALNALPTTPGTTNIDYPDVVNTPRIDNESSFLGLVDFCKRTGKSSNPFADPKFTENCGMCLTSGSLITGEKFTTPTGVVVYGKDKEKAYKVRDNNKYKFARAIPSLNAAVCKDASLSDDSLPVLALNEKDYNTFQKRLSCIHGETVGNGCGKCMLNKKFSWVDPNGGYQPISLGLFGMGQGIVKVGGRQVGDPFMLNETQGTEVSLGKVKEGTQIQIEVQKQEKQDDFYLYGLMMSTNPNGKPYKIPIDRILEKDADTGSTPRRGTSKVFSSVRMQLNKIMAKPNSSRLLLVGQIPFTFIDSDQVASFDCPASPFYTVKESEELLDAGNPCVKPSGQEPGNYSVECLRNAVLEGGCTTAGDYYKNPKAYAAKMKTGDFKMWIQKRVELSETDPDVALKCLNKDIKTPCDDFVGKNTIPSKECMVYLYNNLGANNKRPKLGTSYTETFSNFQSLSFGSIFGGPTVPQFCQPWGTLNPETPQGEGELREKASGYKGKQGMEAVKLYLSDVYKKATSNLDANLPDDQGGKKDSWQKCIGYYLADPKLQERNVIKNASGTVVDTKESCSSLFAKTWTPKRNTILARDVYQTGNYTISFKIKPLVKPSDWSNILRFTNTTKDCCDLGDRSPAIWLHPNMYLHVRIGSDKEGNWGLNTDPIPLNQETSFRLTCEDSKVECVVNNKIYPLTQPGVRARGIMTVFGSDNFYQAANCTITDFCVNIL